MAYSSTIAFDTATGRLSGVVSFTAPATVPPTASQTVSDLVISGYADGAQLNAAAYFGQTRSDGGGAWVLQTNALPGGPHTVAVSVDYGAPLASLSITTAGGGYDGQGSVRRDLLTNNAPRK